MLMGWPINFFKSALYNWMDKQILVDKTIYEWIDPGRKLHVDALRPEGSPGVLFRLPFRSCLQDYLFNIQVDIIISEWMGYCLFHEYIYILIFRLI